MISAGRERDHDDDDDDDDDDHDDDDVMLMYPPSPRAKQSKDDVQRLEGALPSFIDELFASCHCCTFGFADCLQ